MGRLILGFRDLGLICFLSHDCLEQCVEKFSYPVGKKAVINSKDQPGAEHGSRCADPVILSMAFSKMV